MDWTITKKNIHAESRMKKKKILVVEKETIVSTLHFAFLHVENQNKAGRNVLVLELVKRNIRSLASLFFLNHRYYSVPVLLCYWDLTC